jgi:hypothetical protein
LHTVEFPYKKIIGGYAPIIPLTLHGSGVSTLVEAYVDSGAIISLFDSMVADLLEINWQAGKKRPFRVGDGKTIHGFVIRLPVEIGPVSFTGPIAFSSQLKIGFNLLGSSGIFSQFSEVVFQEKNHKLMLRR